MGGNNKEEYRTAFLGKTLSWSTGPTQEAVFIFQLLTQTHNKWKKLCYLSEKHQEKQNTPSI